MVITYLLAHRYGLYGAAASLLVSELIMNVYVMPESLRLSHDTFPAFVASLLHYPPSLRPSALMTRLRRTRPQLEG